MTDTPRTDAAAADLLEAVERLWILPSFKRTIYEFITFTRDLEREQSRQSEITRGIQDGTI